jgi:hypothetical protein
MTVLSAASGAGDRDDQSLPDHQKTTIKRMMVTQSAEAA